MTNKLTIERNKTQKRTQKETKSKPIGPTSHVT